MLVNLAAVQTILICLTLALGAESKGSIRDEILEQIWNGDDPFNYVNASQKEYIDSGYPHSNLREDIVDYVVRQWKPTFWLEAGSMLGGSIIRTANKVKQLGINTSIISLDPFTGDVNMIAWEHEKFLANAWRFVKFDKGRGRIYDRFMANIDQAGHRDLVIPIPTTAIVGFKALKRLFDGHRISKLPEVIYLDSAHEIDETLMEMKAAWQLLQPGGILFGDDWNWGAVKHDVSMFAAHFNATIDNDTIKPLKVALNTTHYQDGVPIYQNQWFLIKKK